MLKIGIWILVYFVFAIQFFATGFSSSKALAMHTHIWPDICFESEKQIKYTFRFAIELSWNLSSFVLLLVASVVQLCLVLFRPFFVCIFYCQRCLIWFVHSSVNYVRFLHIRLVPFASCSHHSHQFEFQKCIAAHCTLHTLNREHVERLLVVLWKRMNAISNGFNKNRLMRATRKILKCIMHDFADFFFFFFFFVLFCSFQHFHNSCAFAMSAVHCTLCDSESMQYACIMYALSLIDPRNS